MSASTKAILTNVERMASDDVLLKLWNREGQVKNEDGSERTIGQTWTAFIAAAAEAKVADRIPGAVGRTFRKKYADDPAGAAEAEPKKQRPAKAGSRPAQASAGSKVGGSGQRRSKAAPAAEKAAGK